MEIPLNDEEMLDILGSLLMDEFYASEIWQPVPATTKREKTKARMRKLEREPFSKNEGGFDMA